ncbi:T9SS type A sorting domain-containing protein [Pontibacter vulgaris]|uniref:T9SS type A sorting domain-containing protein n=1 Tax=Pontibacter vulgaris TaxID=2905679 RepID=UPI001FA7F86E|nr:T9SS type A sorting domain-containing protein [Pontibacter vulgaris]
MKTFTQLVLTVALTGAQLLGFALNAHSEVAGHKVNAGVSPVNKGGATVWKMMPEKQKSLVLSAQNARPAFIISDNEHNCSKIYESAVAPSFHSVETASIGKSMYSAITLAAFAPGRDIKELPSIHAYPNPSRGITRFSLNHSGNDNYKIRVSNTIGRVIHTQELTAADNTDLVLNMESWPAGVYFYSLLVNNKTIETKRLIIQK